MHSYFKEIVFRCSLIVVVVGCAPARKASNPRAPQPRLVITTPIALNGRDLTSQELIEYFFNSSKNQNACERLYSIPLAGINEARFRILEAASVTLGSGVDENGNLKKNDCTFVCANPLNWGSARCRICKEAPIDLVDVWGRVGIGTHPLYEIAMSSVDLPSRDEFMSLVSKEREKFGLVMLPFFETYRALINMGFKDAIQMRNKIIQERIDQAFPGAFRIDGTPSKMEESLSLAIIVNALPNYSTFLLLPSDTPAQRKAKTATMSEVIRALSRPLPYFRSNSWKDFSDDAVSSINASVKSMQSSNPVQHACAMALLHRNFAQMLRIVGYARLPTVIATTTAATAFAVPFSQLLGTPDGTKFAVCPAPGSYYSGNTRLMLGEERLSNYSSDKQNIQMSGQIETLRRCSRAEARVYSDSDLERIAFGKPSRRATGEDQLAMMKVLSHQLTAFNPSSTWWARSDAGFPLGEFSDFDTIEKSGSVLPYQYHALALGLLQVSLGSLLENHIVQIDSSFKETAKANEVVGLRLSSSPRKIGSTSPIETSIESALTITEIAFKAGAYLKQLPKWKLAQTQFYNSEYRKFGTASEKSNYKKMNENFINGLFGAPKNLSTLAGEAKLPNGEYIQDQVDQLKVASAVLLATFAKVTNDSTDDDPRFTCVAKVVTQLKEGVETKKGLCSPAQEKVWKKTFSWLSAIYQSPLFASYAK